MRVLAIVASVLLLSAVPLAGLVRGGDAAVPLITTDELKTRTAGSPDKWDLTLIDARTRVEFEEGHVKGALNLPASQTKERLPELVKDKGRTLVFYCNGPRCTKSMKGARAALELGYTKVLEYNEGLPAWGKARLPIEGTPLPAVEAPALAPADLKAKLEKAPGTFVLDIRDASEFEAFHLAGSKNFPLDDLAAKIAGVPEDRPVVIVDHIGHQAVVGARLLGKHGRKKLERLDGGIMAWRAQGLPVEGKDAPKK